MRAGAAGVLAALALFAGVGRAQASDSGCVVDTLTAGFPGQWLGTRVGQITVQAHNVDVPSPTLRSAVGWVHHPTRLNVVMNELSFAPDEPMDSLQVQESVRRLRRTQLFSDLVLEGTSCGGITNFRLITHDAWSVRANVRLSSGVSSRFSLSDVNLFGTGRTVAMRSEEVENRRTWAAVLVDPYLLDSRFRGAAMLRNYADGRSWSGGVRTRELSPRDPWREALLSSQLRRLGDERSTQTHVDLERRATSLTVSGRVLLEPEAAYAVVAGVESERTNLSVVHPGPSLGHSQVKRQFVAPLFGIARRSLEFRSLSWLVPGQQPAELPVGIDAEVVAGIGHELNSNARITHLDGWMGGTAQPTAATVLTGDVWASGYWMSDSVSNGTLRLTGALYQRAPRGMWIVRVASERLYNPDPDVFALSTVDPLLRTLAPTSRLAEHALSVWAERSVHLYARDAKWVLDGALFTSYVERNRSVDPTIPTAQNLHAMIVGIGLRRIRSQPTQSPLRLDIGRAVWRSPGLPDHWIVLLSISPWINANRVRDGMREIR